MYFIGTGKSTVGAHLAYTFAKLNQISTRRSKKGKTRCVVYCGASNTSVDVVASTYVCVCMFQKYILKYRHTHVCNNSMLAILMMQAVTILSTYL